LAAPSFPHYPATAILRLSNIVLPVVYKSPHFCRTGWGFRSLSLKELACSFDLPSPSHSVVDCREIFTDLLPLKLLEAPLQHVLSSLASSVPAPAPSVTLLPMLGVAPPTHKTWLPSIKKFLPDSWCDETLISDKAAKSDKAPVPIHLWDNRSKMVFPQLTDSALSGFRTLALIWQRKYMHRQFCTFLRKKYGPDWLPRLLKIRAQAKALAVAAMTTGGTEESPPPRKRVRRGGVDTSGSVADGFLPARTELLLHLDGDAGCQVLNQYFGGQWWDWKAGSALAFWRWNGEEQIEDARDGMRVYIKDTLPKNKRAQRVPKPEDLRLMIAKLDKVLDRGYITPQDL
jgi:hypothetical protein